MSSKKTKKKAAKAVLRAAKKREKRKIRRKLLSKGALLLAIAVLGDDETRNKLFSPVGRLIRRK